MFIDSFKCSKIKPLFLLIACICLFVSLSCIHAADIDDGIKNQTTGDVNALDDGAVEINIEKNISSGNTGEMLGETPNQKTSDMSGISYYCLIMNNRHPINHNHLTEKTHFGNKDKKSDYGFSDLRQDYKICSNFEKIKHHPKTLDDSHKLCKKGIAGAHTHRMGFQKLIALNIENVIKNDIFGQLRKDTPNSFKKVMHRDSHLTKKSEPCCCRDCKCTHHCHHDVEVISNGKVILSGDCGDDMTYSYNTAYKHINSTANEGIVFRFRDLDEDEIENRNLINVTAFNCTQNQPGNEKEFAGFNAHSDLDLNGDFALICSNSFYDSKQSDCSINDFYSQKLNIKDYNLEYYIFTNPDIIIMKANVNLAENHTLTSNHCPNFDVKTAFNPTIFFNNDLQVVFYLKSLASNNIKEDNCIPSDFTVSYQNDYLMLNGSVCKSDGQTPINLSADESACTVLLIYGGTERCLI